ncbi:hypothetical protein D3C74_157100 [compost metagenome]
MKHPVFRRVLLSSTIMMLIVAGSAYAEEGVVLKNGETQSIESNIRLTPKVDISATPPVVSSTDLVIVSEEVALRNQKKFVTTYIDYGVGQTIPGSIVYSEDNGSAGRWGGTLPRTKTEQIGNYTRAYFEGWVYKDID